MIHDTIETLISLNRDALNNGIFVDKPVHWRLLDQLPLDHILQLIRAAANTKGVINNGGEWFKVCSILNDYDRTGSLTDKERRYLTITMISCIIELSYHI